MNGPPAAHPALPLHPILLRIPLRQLRTYTELMRGGPVLVVEADDVRIELHPADGGRDPGDLTATELLAAGVREHATELAGTARAIPPSAPDT